jgi:hypothetical protein
MALRSFSHADLITVSDALNIAEDVTGNFFKFSFGQWKRHRYDVRTLCALNRHEIRPYAFALLNKSIKQISEYESTTRKQEYYSICLQDHLILNALRKDRDLGFIPLLIYIFTHELVHIVRFSNFLKRFDAADREREEMIVHSHTYEILKELPMAKMDYILDSYQDYRLCDMAL